MFRGGGQHPRGEQPGDEQRDRAQAKQLDAEGDAGGDGQHADAGAGERADAPAAVQSGHQHPPPRSLDGDGLGVHRDVEGALERAPGEQGREQGRQAAGEPDQRPGCAVAGQRGLHDPAAA
jgi:hypothetical protein